MDLVKAMVKDCMRFKLYTDPSIMSLVGHENDFRSYNKVIGISGGFKREK